MRYGFLISLGIIGLCTACGPDMMEEVAEAYASLPDKIDYNFHVKPILSDRCFACHGPDAQNQQADLRLDIAEEAYAPLSSGNGFAIVPGSPGKSEMIRRINAQDPDLIMPTPESNLQLDDWEIAVLTKWVQQGAKYKTHWAFTPPEQPPVPNAGGQWAHNEIDRFVAAGHAAADVSPAPEAEREYLIRRVFFDLNGLPPSLSELDQWTKDQRPDWYEQLVDELLARPAYGERMATYWLDVARFADSEGYLDDFHHALWPYRDWVISAYNRNLPYDDFIEWQVGGDQFEDPSREQILATTFNRNHKQNSEGGIIAEEFRVEYVADRTNTVGTAFLGLTMGCARCHDHKYDPISQKDYFELFSFFNNTVERGDAIFALNALENGQMVENFYAMNAGPTLPLPDSATQAIQEHLEAMIAEKERNISLLRQEMPAPAATPTKNDLRKTMEEHTVNYLNFDQDPLRDLAPGGAVKWNSMELATGKYGRGIRSGEGQLVADGEGSQFERSEPFTVSFWIKTVKFIPEGHAFFNGNNKNQGYRGWDVMIDSNRVHLRLNHAHPFQSIDLRIDQPLVNNEWTHFVWSYDGSSQAEGMRVYRDGQRVSPAVIRDHLVRSTRPYTYQKALVYERYNGLTIGARHYDQDFEEGMLDEIRVLNTEAGDLLARYLYEGPEGRFQVGQNGQELSEYHQLHRAAGLQSARAELTALRTRAVETIDTVREVMVMGDDTRLRPTYVLDRGVYDAHGEPVERGIPEALMDWPEDLPKNRFGLGKWLTHPDNPLTARVAVNQLWYLMFGRGIVESVEDFGNQGSLPSHPELLDWLAVDFREHGWDVKRLIRQMVTAATYRQSSVIREELREVDPDNKLLARGQRYRRSAEMVRDNLLAASGLLEEKVGGASVFPYQPPGLWRELSSHGHSPAYEVDTDNGLYRRSLYTFWKRNAPPPAMMVFDASTRGECQVRRQRSNTPLQALVLLNDPQTIAACRALASRTLQRIEDPASASAEVFRTLIGRPPTSAEREIITQFYEDELAYFHRNPLATQDFLNIGYHPTDLSPGAERVAAMARVANTVMNSTEGYFKN
ncbi:DUF1553 domain-containing protein [Lewinella sp. W8]|uniref:DUF1553 domain-containing protein n=1 Tax=Lewinella sp. W8 TaxID=2528208 RepID=UPI0010686AD4|nr:DUF1553 domain-containing protein [Lewinella sp. W8]MTB51567.1 DUF1553 domain-containing protein [Lewinella sp. W8]